jgi:predicted Zn-dependent protease
MSAVKFWRVAGTAVLSVMVGAGLAYAKLPPLDEAGKAKAAEAAAKTAEANKKAREAEEKAMDRVVEHYKKDKGLVKTTTAAPKKK